jgi:cytochrome c-type biogenesis protein CcmH/NrfG
MSTLTTADLPPQKREGLQDSSYQDAIWELPFSDDPEATQAYDKAREEFQKSNPLGEIASLQQAVEIDPKFARGWLWLGEIYKFNRQLTASLDA